MSDGGLTSHVDGRRPVAGQAKPPTDGGGTVLVDVVVLVEVEPYYKAAQDGTRKMRFAQGNAWC